MDLPVNISIMQVSMAKLMDYYKHEEVLGYCKNCSNYEMNFSCPGLEFNTKQYLKDYRVVSLILTSIETEFIKANEQLYIGQKFPSRVLDNYKKDKPKDKVLWKSEMSMYFFEQVKDWMSDRLLFAEEEIVGSLSIPPGSCTRCESCMKVLGEDCIQPHKLRFSLEALGFLVSDVYKDVFGIKMEWVNGELPSSFHSCSAFVSKKPIDLEQLKIIIGDKK